MDFIDRLRSLGDRVGKLKDQVNTEEATKNAFIMPFLSALGYDVFNPMQVVPEYVADVGIKKGEKVDYCIFKDEKPIIIIECKHWKENLDLHNSQLHRYFHVVQARFAILTNGIDYRLYSDLEESNKMDEKPFFEFNIQNVSDHVSSELKKFRLESFDEESILANASDLKYSKQLKEFVSKELSQPSEEFVRYIAKQVYPGKVTAKILDQFKGITQKAIKQLINEMISDRLQLAIDQNREVIPAEDEVATKEVAVEDDGIETTEEELKGFRIVQAILAAHISMDSVTYRDTKSYFGILYEDNNRQPICRLHLNRSNKYLELFDEEKNKNKVLIEKIEDIYEYKDALIERAKLYAAPEEGATEEA
ncbi:type I restriction endonuclease [Saprospira sp. CCB-QB6]|uniref:type I restriction endonuclease n=1 Tax=Saprospira sp. CCB-QB6 TaxID=3023936 RepID=UPI00234B0212|nr:type I restriction endonuclease [Saprospira sp. CCB-QB6]WCL80515.1 type I restriction endonuclease [Saprospira sp. CCB-QB6]